MQNLKAALTPAPNIASLGKYGDILAHVHKDAPNIGTPIFNLTAPSLPISICYPVSGVKVAEIAISPNKKTAFLCTDLSKGIPMEQVRTA